MTGIFDTLRTAARKRREFNGIISELEALSDRELDDIGIARSDRFRIARETVYGK